MGIEILSTETATLMSVHQVIPDPYILIKELVENSLDAHSSEIKISVYGEKEALRFIVQDNGDGIEVNEHLLALGGTSKQRAPTYGCKGVALYAMSQLGDLCITTRREQDELATEITCTNGQRSQASRFKPEKGTTIAVANFHRASPVRSAHLGKNLGGYLKDIVALAQKCLVAHRVQISVERNGKTLFAPGRPASCPIQRLLAAYPIGEALGTLRADTAGLVLDAVLVPGSGGAEGVMQAGGRIVESSKLLASLTLLGKQLQVRLIFQLQIRHEHPEEQTARTNIGSRSNKHHRLIYKEALLVKEIDELRVSDELRVVSESRRVPVAAQSFISSTISEPTWCLRVAGETQRPVVSGRVPSSQGQSQSQGRSSQDVPEVPLSQAAGAESVAYVIDAQERLGERNYQDGLSLAKEDLLKLRVIGQFNNGFIMAACAKEEGTLIYAIDQHAADEAVNYERLKRGYQYPVQRLLCPLRLSLTAYERYLAEEHAAALGEHGFTLSSDLGSLEEVPVYETAVFGEKELREVLQAIKDEKTLPVIFSGLRKILASKACRSSVMIGDALTAGQMEEIVASLGSTTRPWNCPHGRPTIALLQHTSQNNLGGSTP